jgi:hypothetical protein
MHRNRAGVEAIGVTPALPRATLCLENPRETFFRKNSFR